MHYYIPLLFAVSCCTAEVTFKMHINQLAEKQNQPQAATGGAAASPAASPASVSPSSGADAQPAASASASPSSSASSPASSSSSPSSGAVSEADFKAAVSALGKADAASKATHFMQSLKDAGISTKREAAMFLAQVWHESGALQYKEEIACAGDEAKKAACDASYPIKGNGVKGKHYYGRGYIQLTWDANYEAASKDLLNDPKILLNDPDKVASDESLAWRTAAWYWKTRVHSAPGVQDGKFGATTKAINGALECGAPNEKAKKRFEFYKKIMEAFKDSSKLDESGCY